MKIFPYIYEPDRSIEVFEKTNKYLELNVDVKEKIETLGKIYHEIGEIIPQTTENYWSGHYFPFSESWNDLQISHTQALFGLYKQAFTSLRSGLELGLLSIYYNINDDGHKTVKNWLNSKDSSDSNTPRADKIWKILLSNHNIEKFNLQFNLRARFDSLGYLHNYVHTKGNKYSNSFDGIKGNFQTFEETILKEWLYSYEQIVIIIATMHLLKYPLSVIEFDYSKKFGIDVPNCGGLDKFKTDLIASILPSGYIEEIKSISKTDVPTQKLLEHFFSLPDITPEQVKAQSIFIEKMFIEDGEGFVKWEQHQLKFMNDFISLKTQEDYSEFIEATLNLIEELRPWAQENNFMDSKSKRLGWKDSE